MLYNNLVHDSSHVSWHGQSATMRLLGHRRLESFLDDPTQLGLRDPYNPTDSAYPELPACNKTANRPNGQGESCCNLVERE
jgi:hypothetical protein